MWVLSDMPLATDSSRPGESIAEVKFDVQIDYPGPKPIQSFGFLVFERFRRIP